MQGAMSKNKPICETGSSQASVFVDSVTAVETQPDRTQSHSPSWIVTAAVRNDLPLEARRLPWSRELPFQSA